MHIVYYIKKNKNNFKLINHYHSNLFTNIRVKQVCIVLSGLLLLMIKNFSKYHSQIGMI